MKFTEKSFNKGMQFLIDNAATTTRPNKAGDLFKTPAEAGFTMEDVEIVSVEYTIKFKQWYVAITLKNSTLKTESGTKLSSARKYRYNITADKLDTWRAFQEFITQDIEEDIFGEEIGAETPIIDTKSNSTSIADEPEEERDI